MLQNNPYRGKRILIIGLARSGQAAALLLNGLGATVTVTDTKSAESLVDLLAPLSTTITTVLGGHEGIAPDDYDLAVISPGVPYDAPLPQSFRSAGVAVISEIELAATCITAPIIAITGSNGKSTTTTLIGRALEAMGKVVFTGGNLGNPLTAAVGLPADWIVAELSSFQLEAIQTFKPKIGVMLNVTPDHLDRHGTMDTYAAIKQNVYRNMGPGDTFITNNGDPICAAMTPPEGVTRILFDATRATAPACYNNGIAQFVDPNGYPIPLFNANSLQIPGAHNRENALAAAVASYMAGATPEAIEEAFATFPGLPHRMEWCGEINGVTYVNDSKGTNVDASIKSLSGYDKNVILIAGGSSKGGDFAPFAEAIKAHAKGVVLIGKTAPVIAAALGQTTVPVLRGTDMTDAVTQATTLAKTGDTILLSPACASFDMFANYEARGNAFKSAVATLENKGGG